jgi:hypothetical protein
MYLTQKRAARLAHLQHTNSQYHLPAIGHKLADKANRDGVAARFPAPAVQTSLAVALALRGDDDPLRRALALPIVKAAQQHNAPL